MFTEQQAMGAMGITAEGQAVVAVLGALLVVTISLLCLLLLRRHRIHPTLHLPPSPSLSLPLLGHLLHLRSIRNPSSLQALRDKLGPIFTLHVNTTPVIFITSAALAHEALVEKSLLFAARPQLPSRVLFTNNFRNISAASYGPYWRSMRRNLVQEMLAMSKILSFKPARALVLDRMISRILIEAQQNEGTVTVFPNIRIAMFELLLFMCFGFHMPEDDLLQVPALIDETLQLPPAIFQDFFPYLRVLDRKRRQKASALRAKQVRLYTSHIEKHKELHKLGQLAPGSYIETLLHMDSSNPLSMDDLVTLCSEFLVGGTDTTVTTLEWTMARLVEDPSIQNRLYDQIYHVIGDAPVEEKDLPQLPYLQAVVRETLRLHPPGHFLLPHAVSALCKVGGYDIPPNAVIQFHVASISRDPGLWEEPLKFKPERFLTVDVDITGTKEVTMMPFGAGRRICPGLGLASIHLELFVACLVQAFQWSSFPVGGSVDLTENPIFTVRMKHPLRASVRERRLP